MNKTTFYSNGKLLLSAEYGVLDGALALAIPTTFGQSLTVKNNSGKGLSWTSFAVDGKPWFKATFESNHLEIKDCTDQSIAQTLQTILKEALKLDSKFLATIKNKKVVTNLTFPRNWGLGTSSTLINNVAQWAKVSPYQLLAKTMGGSGYDIACAINNGPIHYQLVGQHPLVEEVPFNPPFKDKLFFVYLNRKQDSRVAILNYRKQDFNKKDIISKLTRLTRQLSTTSDLMEFETAIFEHEMLLSKVLKIEPVKSRLFHDYFGALKSLGGWGGDFILATGNEKTRDYFKAKGFNTVIPYRKMILRET